MKQFQYMRYAVYLYHGGEAPDECICTNSLEQAKEISLRAEHGIIHDNLEGGWIQ